MTPGRDEAVELRKEGMFIAPLTAPSDINMSCAKITSIAHSSTFSSSNQIPIPQGRAHKATLLPIPEFQYWLCVRVYLAFSPQSYNLV